jgi:tight adherence protein B
MKGKKKEVEINKGLFGNAIDYSVYHLSRKESIIGFLVGYLIGFIALQIFFRNVIVSLVIGIVPGLLGIKLNQNRLLEKRKDVLLVQFKDLLESLCTSLGSGRNTIDAFSDSYRDLLNQYGKDSYIVQEVVIIIAGVKNNYTLEQMLMDFAVRSHMEDIQSFADVFEVTNRLGGNIVQVIDETRNIIVDKVNIQLEIATLISGKKNELNIMIVLPFIVVSQLGSFSGSVDFIGILSRIVALLMFAGAYALGQKMINIKI